MSDTEQQQASSAISTPTLTPWEADADVDFEKVIKEFGASALSEETILRLGRAIVYHKHPEYKKEDEELGEGAPDRTAEFYDSVHLWIKRGLFFSERDLNVFLNAYEAGRPTFLYTGRGPSSASLHLGHLIPLTFTAWLQNALGIPCVIQLTDDEKYIWKSEFKSVHECSQLGFENAKDIIACGFDEELTFIFRNTDYIRELYPNILSINRRLTFNNARSVFGFDSSTHCGKIGFPAYQIAPAMITSFPGILYPEHFDAKRVAKAAICLIPCAVDQDPYFKVSRDILPKLNIPHAKPTLIHSKFLPSLQGTLKMSASSASGAINVNDKRQKDLPKAQRKQSIDFKISQSVSGGSEKREEQEVEGSNLSVDRAYKYLEIFLADDAKLDEIRIKYGSDATSTEEERAKYGIGETTEGGELTDDGKRMLTSAVKRILCDTLWDEWVHPFQQRRAEVTDEVVERYMTKRLLQRK